MFCWELISGPLKDQQVLLTSESALLCPFYKNWDLFFKCMCKCMCMRGSMHVSTEPEELLNPSEAVVRGGRELPDESARKRT